MKKMMTVAGAVLIMLMYVLFAAGSAEDDSEENWGASVDWGPDHYWNSQTHTVEENLHGILHH